MKKSLKTELEKLKIKNSKLNPKNFITNKVLSVVGHSLTPTIHQVGMSIGVKRTKPGKYRVHGKTYRTKKLAEKRWLKDCSMLQNFNGKRKGNFLEQLIGGIGDTSGLILPTMYNLFKKKELYVSG